MCAVSGRIRKGWSTLILEGFHRFGTSKCSEPEIWDLGAKMVGFMNFAHFILLIEKKLKGKTKIPTINIANASYKLDSRAPTLCVLSLVGFVKVGVP